MKLRIQGDSIRLRLTRTEVNRFGETGRVEETVHFPDGRRFIYAIVRSSDANSLTASFDGHEMTVAIPQDQAQEWVDTERVGFEDTCTLGEGELHLLIEKDFECLHKRPDEEDAFPNPLAESTEHAQVDE